MNQKGSRFGGTLFDLGGQVQFYSCPFNPWPPVFIFSGDLKLNLNLQTL
ncbi:MAG: hypothetical protein HOK49_09235 [Opitutae bacterium]|jgi:hypothetical protein|nr:hypothetical protein [Opitutae bacterium]MBT7852116.1 hypothetical protein [Opitutae bacterium]